MKQSKDSEIKVSQVLAGYSFRVEKYAKENIRNVKTPDYKVFKEGHFIFYCEVKCAQEDTWLDDQLMKAPPLTIVGGSRPDPIFNRLSTHIYKASKQFDAVNQRLIHPNVLAFVNRDWGSDCSDLEAVLSGQLKDETGENHPIYPQYSEGRIKESKYRIHLYLWIDDIDPNIETCNADTGEIERPSERLAQMFFNTYDRTHLETLCMYFNVAIPRIKDEIYWFRTPFRQKNSN